MPRKGEFQDLKGKKFGRLYVVHLVEKDKSGKYKWLCQCDCGKTKITDTGQLNSGYTQSCGCIKKEILQERNYKHGEAHTDFYNVWSSMKQRCNLKRAKAYKDYGGRGINVCEEWNDFINFYNDMYPTYKKGLTIERIDVNGNYCKENCTWIKFEDQASNTTRSRFVYYNNKKYTASQLAREYGLKPQTFIKRLDNNWDIQKALTTPIRR
jgi:hypothetical protein